MCGLCNPFYLLTRLCFSDSYQNLFLVSEVLWTEFGHVKVNEANAFILAINQLSVC